MKLTYRRNFDLERTYGRAFVPTRRYDFLAIATAFSAAAFALAAMINN